MSYESFEIMCAHAIEFATVAHEGQTRKGGGPYIDHPIRVAKALLAEVPGVSLGSVEAAILHDTVEDTDVTLDEIKERFGSLVANRVDDLTHPEVDPEIAKLPRAARKAIYVGELARSSEIVRIIKLLDTIDNLETAEEFKTSFMLVYAAESHRLADAIGFDLVGYGRAPALAKKVHAEADRITALAEKRIAEGDHK